MHVAVRPNLAAAGVALAAASVVAASSIAPLPDIHLPDLHAPAAVERALDVSLAAASDPLSAYSQVVQSALTNITELIKAAKPGEVVGAVLANQSANLGAALGALGSTGGAVAGALAQAPQVLATAAAQLAAGNLVGATNALLLLPLNVALPLTGLFPALTDLLTKPVQNVVNIINAFTSDQLGTELALSGLIAPLISTPAAAIVAAQNVLTAVVSLNPAAIANALLTAPATIADGLINGGYGPDLGPLVGLTGIGVVAGGLLASTSVTSDSDGNPIINTGGPLAGLQQILDKIAGVLNPPAATLATAKVAATDVAGIPSVTAPTLSTASSETAADTAAKSAATAAEAPAKDTASKDSAKDAVSTKDSTTGSTATDSTTKDATKTDTKDATKADTETETGTKTPAKTATKDDGTSADKGVDVKSGNKVSPTKPSASDSAKSDSATSGGKSAAGEESSAAAESSSASPSHDAGAAGSGTGSASKSAA